MPKISPLTLLTYHSLITCSATLSHDVSAVLCFFTKSGPNGGISFSRTAANRSTLRRSTKNREISMSIGSSACRPPSKEKRLKLMRNWYRSIMSNGVQKTYKIRLCFQIKITEPNDSLMTPNENSDADDSFIDVNTNDGLWHVLPWPKKLRQARKPNIGACMLDRSRACATCARLSQFFRQGSTTWL